MASGKQPSRAARQHGETCRVLFSHPNKPRHRHGTVLQRGNAGNSILSFRKAILSFSFQSYHLAAQSCRLVRHPIIWFLHSFPIICNPILFVTPRLIYRRPRALHRIPEPSSAVQARRVAVAPLADPSQRRHILRLGLMSSTHKLPLICSTEPR